MSAQWLDATGGGQWGWYGEDGQLAVNNPASQALAGMGSPWQNAQTLNGVTFTPSQYGTYLKGSDGKFYSGAFSSPELNMQTGMPGDIYGTNTGYNDDKGGYQINPYALGKTPIKWGGDFASLGLKYDNPGRASEFQGLYQFDREPTEVWKDRPMPDDSWLDKLADMGPMLLGGALLTGGLSGGLGSALTGTSGTGIFGGSGMGSFFGNGAGDIFGGSGSDLAGVGGGGSDAIGGSVTDAWDGMFPGGTETGNPIGNWGQWDPSSVAEYGTVPVGGGTQGAGTLSKLWESIGVSQDTGKIIERMAPSLLGILGSSAQGSALKDVAAQQAALQASAQAMGAPYRAQALDMLKNPNSFFSGPVAQSNLQGVLQGLSVNGNPFGNPTSLALAQQGQRGLYNQTLANFGQMGGLSGYNAAGANQSLGADLAIREAMSQGNTWNAVGSGLNAVLNPQPSLVDILKQIQGLGGTSLT